MFLTGVAYAPYVPSLATPLGPRITHHTHTAYKFMLVGYHNLTQINAVDHDIDNC